jgi:hypothetical protein
MLPPSDSEDEEDEEDDEDDEDDGSTAVRCANPRASGARFRSCAATANICPARWALGEGV